MKILIDMNLSPSWTTVLDRHGWEAVHWSMIGVVGAIVLAIYSPPFRVVALAVLGVAALLAVIFFVYLKESEDSSRKEEELSKHRIPLSQIDIVDTKLGTGRWSSLTGRIRNKSQKYELSQVELQLTVRDCIEENCEVVEETKAGIDKIVPPGQSRDFDEYVSLQLGKLRGKFVWSYQILSISGR